MSISPSQHIYLSVALALLNVSVKSSPEPKDMFQTLFATVRPTITRLLDAKYPKQLDYFAVKIVKDSPEKSIEKLVANVDELYETIAKNLKV